MKCKAVGPENAKIMLVGEAPGAEEERTGIPFVGGSGQLLDQCLTAAGISREECYITNLCQVRPPDNDFTRLPYDARKAGFEELQSAISRVRPNVIVPLGNTALVRLTGETSITKWRGSILESEEQKKLIPAYHPADVLRQMEWQPLLIQDLSRAKDQSPYPEIRHPEWNFTISPSFPTVLGYLRQLKAKMVREEVILSGDIETRYGHISCFGIAEDPHNAICIPFIKEGQSYWTETQEATIVHLLSQIFNSENAQWIFQNGLFDLQYFARFWGAVPNILVDTMLVHHALWPGMRKGLDFLASLYCDYYRYWKAEGKMMLDGVTEEDNWHYNCLDCVYTYEVANKLGEACIAEQMMAQADFQMSLFRPVFKMMLRGVRCDERRKNEIAMELMQRKEEITKEISHIVGHPLNPRSAKQMKEFFLGEVHCRPVRRNGRVTFDDKALSTIAVRYPLLQPLIERIKDLRSTGVFLSTFALMPLDADSRLRCSYNIAGTETLRFSSSRNVFGSGTNLENVPAGDSTLPNIRKIFIPDEGMEMADIDLERADLQVVAWEANDQALKDIFHGGYNPHIENAKALFSLTSLTHDDPRYKKAKTAVHAANYLVSPPTLSRALGIPASEAEYFINRWYEIHPGIRLWHERIRASLHERKMVTNKFGFRRVFFDRMDEVLKSAIAWIPQSTVANVTNIALHDISTLPDVEISLQNHDSWSSNTQSLKRSRASVQSRGASPS